MTAVPQVAIDAVNHYLSKGLSKDAATAIVSVLYAGESKLDPGSHGKQPTEHGGALNADGSYGIASWNGPRQQNLLDFATKKMLQAGDLNTQLDFVLTEAANEYPDFWTAIRSTMSYRDIVDVMVRKYEIPADVATEVLRADTFGKDLYALIAPSSAPVPMPPITPIPIPTLPISLATLPSIDPALLAKLEPLLEILFRIFITAAKAGVL